MGINGAMAVETPPDKVRIMLLAANPLSTGRLAIEDEAREIAQKLRLSRDREDFDLITCWAVQPTDLLQHLNQYRPHVVHFSGHGTRSGEIVLSAGDGTGRPVGIEAMAGLFRIMRDDIRVVMLNACYTVAQARTINQHIDFVIGTRAAVADEAATVFAAAFYSALGFGRTIPHAFDQARAALIVHDLPGHDIPELLVRPEADHSPLSQRSSAPPGFEARRNAVATQPPAQITMNASACGNSRVYQAARDQHITGSAG